MLLYCDISNNLLVSPSLTVSIFLFYFIRYSVYYVRFVNLVLMSNKSMFLNFSHLGTLIKFSKKNHLQTQDSLNHINCK